MASRYRELALLRIEKMEQILFLTEKGLSNQSISANAVYDNIKRLIEVNDNLKQLVDSEPDLYQA